MFYHSYMGANNETVEPWRFISFWKVCGFVDLSITPQSKWGPLLSIWGLPWVWKPPKCSGVSLGLNCRHRLLSITPHPTPDPAGLNSIFGDQLKLEIDSAGGDEEWEFYLVPWCSCILFGPKILLVSLSVLPLAPTPWHFWGPLPSLQHGCC